LLNDRACVVSRRRGLALSKSRWQLGSDNLGGYQILDMTRNLVVLGNRFELDLDDVQNFLTDLDRK
jgi:hypothetical protein